MGFRIVVAGESQCDMFAKTCLLADYLMQNLPDFCYERIEKSVLEWKSWLCKANQKNNWHHIGSPLVWKELLMGGSKPFYIGSASDFLEYCNSYYQLDVFMSTERFRKLTENIVQYRKKEKSDDLNQENLTEEEDVKSEYTICIHGAGNPLTMYLISGLLELSFKNNTISKIYIYDKECTRSFMELVEKECSYIGANYSGKVVKYVEKLGMALIYTDILIIMDHIPFQSQFSIGEWLYKNKKIMENIAITLNMSAAQTMRIIIPNLGPACYNATILSGAVKNVNKYNIVVITSDLGMDIAPTIAEVTEMPLQNMFCPPVWGFVGINQLVDIKTTIHRYDSFKPYDRYAKIKNSTLCIGTLIPEMRTMEYLLHFDETFWKKIGETNAKHGRKKTSINTAIAIINLVKIWLLDPNPEYIVSLGIHCDGTFGLTFKGVFSQPSNFINGEWKPASKFLLPKDNQISLHYLQEIAMLIMKFNDNELPPIKEYTPCICKRKYFRKKGFW